jgi:anti-anti-sigma regulatory factor
LRDESLLYKRAETHRTLGTAGGDVNLVQPTPAVRSVLELTRLSRIFEIWDDEPSAVTALAS